MYPHSFEALSCGLLRPGPLTGRCAKLMELAFALSKNWDLLRLQIQRQNRHTMASNTAMARAMGNLVCAINFVF
jgi:hypothetical protein